MRTRISTWSCRSTDVGIVRRYPASQPGATTSVLHAGTARPPPARWLPRAGSRTRRKRRWLHLADDSVRADADLTADREHGTSLLLACRHKHGELTKIRLFQVIFAGAVTVAALALFSATRPVDTQPPSHRHPRRPPPPSPPTTRISSTTRARPLAISSRRTLRTKAPRSANEEPPHLTRVARDVN